MMRIARFAILCAGLLTVGAGAENAAGQSTALQPGQAATDWSFSASAYTYLVPDSGDYVQPTITVDRRWLHLEARYNYEDLDTGSVWVGYNFRVGEKLSLDLTPMLGGVFGKTTGIAPGVRGSLKWWRLELYGEGEYVFDTGESADSFFYLWSELTVSPVDWLRAGLVAQRTRVYESELDINRGFLVGLNYKQVEVAGHVFNPDLNKPAYVISVRVEFKARKSDGVGAGTCSPGSSAPDSPWRWARHCLSESQDRPPSVRWEWYEYKSGALVDGEEKSILFF